MNENNEAASTRADTPDECRARSVRDDSDLDTAREKSRESIERILSEKRARIAMQNEAASTRADEWLTVSQAAAALEVSERTVRRRCESGKLAARLTTTDSGAAWEVSAAAVKAADAAAITADTLRPRSESESDEAAAIPTDTADSARQLAAIAADSDFLAHLQSENVFLRAQVEAANRQAAEATAALREYLKINAKALPSREYSQPMESAQNSAEAPKIAAAAKVTGAAKTGGKREPRPLWKLISGIR